jgi:hypothetical protein
MPISPFPISFWGKHPQNLRDQTELLLASSFRVFQIKTWSDEVTLFDPLESVGELVEEANNPDLYVAEAWLLEKEERNRTKLIPDWLVPDVFEPGILEYLEYEDQGLLTVGGLWQLSKEERNRLKTYANALRPIQDATLIANQVLGDNVTLRVASLYARSIAWRRPGTFSITGFSVVQTSVSFSWTASESASYYQVYVRVSGGNWTTAGGQITNLSARSYSASGLNEGTTYEWKVLAGNGGTNLSDPNTFRETAVSSGVTRPPQPTGLNRSVVAFNRIDISWNTVHPSATGVRVRIWGNENGVQRDQSFNVPVSTTFRSFTDLVENTTYYFQVYATNDAGDSTPAYTDGTTPYAIVAVPNITGVQGTSVCVSGSNLQRISVGWQNTTTSSLWVTDIQRRIGEFDAFVDLADATGLAISQSTFVDTQQISNNPTRYYRVRHRRTDGGGATEWSPAPYLGAQANMACTQPGPFSITSFVVSGTVASLQWSPSDSATSYEIRRNGATILTGYTQTSWQDLSLTRDQLVWYEVVAHNSSGIQRLSGPTASKATIPWTPVMGQPYEMNGTVYVTWTNNNAHETGYILRRLETGQQWTTGQDVVSFQVPAQPGTNHTFAVQATNDAGSSGESAPLGVFVPMESPGKPGVADVSYLHEGNEVSRVEVYIPATADSAWQIQVERKVGGTITLLHSQPSTGPLTFFDGSLPHNVQAEYRGVHYRDGFSPSPGPWSDPITTLTRAPNPAWPQTFDGFDSSTCENGALQRRKSLVNFTPPGNWQSGWLAELQGEYDFPGNWRNPVDGSAGSYITNIGAFDTTWEITVNVGTWNTYRARWRKQNNNNPFGNWDTTSWQVKQVQTELSPCLGGNPQNVTAEQLPWPWSYCNNGSPVITVMVSWTAPAFDVATRVWSSTDGGATWSYRGITAQGASSYDHIDNSGLAGLDYPFLNYRVQHVQGATESQYGYTRAILTNPC